MNKTRKRSFTALLFVLASLFVLVLSLGIFSACGSNETANIDDSASGSTWYYGDKEPAETLGKAGDFYLNTETLASYVKEGKTWRLAAEGETGEWHYGITAPQDAMGEAGNAGDFYLNTATGELYQKSETGWGTAILTLQGQKGRDGVMWFSGVGIPGTIDDAVKGDFYLNTDGFIVYRYQEDENGVLAWTELGTLKGSKGENAKDPIHFANGDGAPGEDNPETQDPHQGDLYLGKFDGLDGKGAGTRLYRYLDGSWVVLMENMKETRVDVHSYAQLVTLATNIQGGKDYAGMEVHLKNDIDFNEIESVSLRRAIESREASDWLPIGTKDHPFRGTFDGEGNTIRNFKTAVSTDATEVGFFGNIDGATIQHLHFVDVVVDATEAVSGPVGAVGAVVVGQAQGAVTVKDVTVTNATVNGAEENNATVGGLVGKLESSETADQTTLTVEGSSFTGSGATDLVADKGTVEDVTITDSSVTDGEGNKTAWDEGGNHYAEDKEGNQSYFVGSAEDITNLVSKAEAGKTVNVTLESDLTLDGTAEESFTLDLAGKDLVLDLAGNDLTLNSAEKNAQFTVSGGSKLTVTDQTGTGVVHMGRVEKNPVISVNGVGSALNFENVKVDVNNTYDCKNERNTYKIAPAIVAENKGTVNIGSGTSITAHGQGNEMSYKEPQIAAANGEGSTIMVNGEDIMITLDNATGLYAQEGGKIDFRSGRIDMTGGSFNVALGLGKGNYGEIVFSGGEINITGNLEGTQVDPNLKNFAIAIGATTIEPEDGLIVVNGGTINLKNTGGSAIAVGGVGYYGIRAFVGDGAAINVQATGNGKAYALASEDMGNGLVGILFSDADIKIGETTNNFKLPTSSIGGGYLGDSGWLLYDGSGFMKATKMSDDRTGCEYTKKAMGIVTE